MSLLCKINRVACPLRHVVAARSFASDSGKKGPPSIPTGKIERKHTFVVYKVTLSFVSSNFSSCPLPSFAYQNRLCTSTGTCYRRGKEVANASRKGNYCEYCRRFAADRPVDVLWLIMALINDPYISILYRIHTTLLPENVDLERKKIQT